MSKNDDSGSAWDFKIEVTKTEEEFKVKPKSNLTQIIRVSPLVQKAADTQEKPKENLEANSQELLSGREKFSELDENIIVQELNLSRDKEEVKPIQEHITPQGPIFINQKEEVPDYLKPDQLPESSLGPIEIVKKKPQLRLEKTQTFIVTRRQMAEERTQLRLGLNLPAANEVRLKSMAVDFGVFLLILFSSGKISFIIFTPICNFLSNYINKGNFEYIKHVFAPSITDPVLNSWWMSIMTIFGEHSVGFLKFVPSFMSAFVFLGFMMYFFVIPLSKLGKSPGKNIFRIRVAHEDGSNLSMTEAFRREIFYKFFSVITIVGPFLFLKEDGKAIHDKMASSVVLVDRRQNKRPA